RREGAAVERERSVWVRRRAAGNAGGFAWGGGRMRWRSVGRGAVVALLLTAAAVGPSAGRSETDPAADPAAMATATAVALGGWTFDLDPAEPLVVYVIGRTASLDGATLRLQPFARTTFGFVPLPSYETAATGRLAAAEPGDAFVLAAEPANG